MAPCSESRWRPWLKWDTVPIRTSRRGAASAPCSCAGERRRHAAGRRPPLHVQRPLPPLPGAGRQGPEQRA
eukprot:6032105-Prymnesium_polylepis.1